MPTLICWLQDVEKDQVGLVGGKGANLAFLLRLGLPVPPGFVVTTETYRTFLAINQLSDVTPLEMRQRILLGPIPPEISAPILAAYHQLDGSPVAVRSSGTAEDLASASFAGQHDTFLNVEEAETLLTDVRACWASLWSPRAIEYRRQRAWNDHDLALAVVVQTMVPTEWAGVLFTADPVTGQRDCMIIEAVQGLGEALVSGQATGYRYTVEKSSLRVLEGAAGLPQAALREVARLGKHIEAAVGQPQDIEWAYTNGHTAILQARPLTALPSHRAEAPSVQRPQYSRLQRAAAPNAMEHIPAAPYPFDYSLFFRPVIERLFAALRAAGFTTPTVDDSLVEVADGVVQIVPPDVRPTLRVVTLPLKLAKIVRVSADDWLKACRGTLVTLAQRTDAEDLSTLSEQDLLHRIDSLQHLQLNLLGSRFAAFPRGLLESQRLTVLLRLVLGKHASEVEREVLAGIPCITTFANYELTRLARHIGASHELRQIFFEEPPDRLAARLSTATEGHALLAEVNAFLQKYGYRETTMPSAAFPSWRDDPSIVYGLLKGLVAGELASLDRPTIDHERVARAKRTVITALTQGWVGWAKPYLAPHFLNWLDTTRAFIAFREDSHFYLFMVFPVIRRVALELGRRFVERGSLKEAEDIFFLKIDEIKSLGSALMQETVRKRKEARRSVEGSYTIVPVDLLERTSKTEELRGTPISPGRAVGPVRIILTERDFWKLQKGEVLVTRYTNPTWTPLFTLACAVVVDTGGTASHAAIVAREYGLPAVMGAHNATQVLHDGQQVMVDGGSGRVVPLPGGLGRD